MLSYSATTTINAPPEKVWKVITDTSHYTEWDKNMIKLEGEIAPGEQLTILTKLDPNRAFKPKVTVFEPHKKMVWSSGMPMGLFKGERTFLLTSKAAGTTEFTLKEEFSGLMLPLIGRSIPDMNPVFAEFAAGLKRYVEG